MRELTDQEIKGRIEQILIRFNRRENAFFAGCFGLAVLAAAAGYLAGQTAQREIGIRLAFGLGAMLGASLLYVAVGYIFKWQGLKEAEKAFNQSFPNGTPLRQRAVDFLGTVKGECKAVGKELHDAVGKPKIEWAAQESADQQLKSQLESLSDDAPPSAPAKSEASSPAQSRQVQDGSRPERKSAPYDYIPLEPERHPGDSAKPESLEGEP